MRNPTPRLALLTLAVALGLSCSRSQPDKPTPAAKAAPAAAPVAAPAPAALIAALETARGAGLCELAAHIEMPRDAGLLGPALDRAFALRRDELDRECSFKLLKSLQANERLHGLAAGTGDRDRWMAIVYHANRNLRARHFDVYDLALKSAHHRVHHAVAGGLGAYGPEAEAVALLERALQHGNENVRLKAARSLIEIGGPEAMQILQNRSTVEKDKAVIVTIHRALNKP